MGDLVMTILKKMVAEKDAFKLSFREHMKNEKTPLSERWEEFCYAVNNGIYHSDRGYIWHNNLIEKELNLCWHDDFYMDKYQYKDFPSIVEGIEEDMDWDDDSVWTVELLDRLKEDMLQSGYSGFTFDW